MLQAFIIKFQVYWNIPSEICFSQSSITSVEDYGFIVNTNHSFYGEHIVTLYSNKFGAYPCYDEYGVEHFGGLPQKANLTEHLLKVKADIKVAIPNENFNGLAIIDYEEWRPLFAMNWGSKHIYQQKSVEYVYNRTRNISKKSAISIATIEFERYALRFMTATLQLGKKLRPKGKWGFYGFPYCNSEAGRSELTCSPDFQRLNNWLIKLLWHANVLYPSIYFSGESPTNYNYLHAAAVLTEAKRLSLMFQQPKPVYAFTKFEYNSYSVQNTFYKRADLCASIAQSFNLGIDGLIFWSTSKRIRERCSALNEFVQTVVGPYVQAITAFSEYCSIAKCSG
uniref:Hyaluronidase n=1 Tax=Syphacia muris TaxID=451379 RepID=A0A0N5A9Y7_9BILA